jgi:Rho-binding antiterminator
MSDHDSPTDYQPINCELHDVLEAAATLRKPVAILSTSPDGASSRRKARITDIFGKDRIEYVVLDNGETIRLDALTEVDGVVFR